MKIRLRIILAIILTNTLIIALGIFAGNSYMRSNIEEYIEKDMLVVADMADEFISAELSLLKSEADFTASNIADADSADPQDTLRAQAQKYPRFIGMSVMSTDGTIEATVGAAPAVDILLQSEAFKLCVGGSDAFTSTVPTNDGLVIYLLSPIPDEQRHIMVLVLDGEYFSDLVSDYHVWESGHVFIDDADGYIIANIRDDWVQDRQNFILLAQDDSQFEDTASVVSKVIAGERGVGYYSIDGEERACAYSPISGSEEGWCLGIVAPLSESPITNYEQGLIFAAIIAMILNVIAAIVASGFIRKPFAQVVEFREVAEESTRAKSRFLAHMSHEIRTPLNAVVGLSELSLDHDKLDKETAINLEKIHSSGMTILSIVNDILDISKIESGKMELFPTRYSTPSAINDIISLNLVRIGEKSIDFKLVVDENLPITLYGDDLRIKQIFNNLLTNAFKYTDEGSVKWSIDFEQDGDDIWLISKIEDTGIGIKNSDLEKLFSDYNQVDTSASRKVEGTGLGLAITKQLLELMDGTISVSSKYGKGTIVHVRLRQGFVDEHPIGKFVAQNLMGMRYRLSKRKELAGLPRIDLSYAHVLIVDDVDTNIDVARGILKPYKLQIDAATSGRQAIEMVRAGKPYYSAIFMDHMMPGMDGIEATKIIREQIDTDYARNVPIIAFTANAMVGSQELFLSKGFQDFISKPIDIAQLDKALHKWVRDKAKEEALGIGLNFSETDGTINHDSNSYNKQDAPNDPKAIAATKVDVAYESGIDHKAEVDMSEVKKPKIMLVDDNLTSLSLGKNLLKDQFEVYALPSAERLYKFLDAVIPVLILLDIEMPDIDGFEVIKKLKADERFSNIPVIFVSSHFDDIKRSEGLSLGAVDFVKKPFDAQDLLARINKHIN